MEKILTDAPASRKILGPKGAGRAARLPHPRAGKAVWDGDGGTPTPRRAGGDPRDTYTAQALRETK